MLINELISKFDNYKIINRLDTLDHFHLKLETDCLPSLDKFYEIENILKKYPKRDYLNMCIKILESEDDFFNIIVENGKLRYYGSKDIVENNNINYIISKFNSIKVEEDKLEITINIKKEYKNKFISIYSVEDFIQWILEKDIYHTITFFSEIYKYTDYIAFVSYDEEIKILTETFQILTQQEELKESVIDRKHVLDCRLDVTNIQKLELNVVPEDFNIKKYEYKNANLKERLNCIRDILSIIYVSDIASIEESFSEFKINGYKSSEFKIFYKDIEQKNKNDNLYDIYRWIYNDGNLIDKCTIARNIISLYCRHQSILELDDEIFNSIKTNYAYYLKTNTDDFLQEKKSLQLLIIEEGKSLSEALYGLIDSMGKNLLAYFTFLATLIVSNTLKQGKFKNIFTFEVVQILAIIILGSFLFLIYSDLKTYYKKKRIDDYIEDLTTGYGVLLGEINVTKIIKNVKSYSNIKDKFKVRKIIINIIWIVLNGILFLFLDWISGDIKILKFINIFK